MRVKEHFQNFVIVSVAFIVASSLTLGFVFPLFDGLIAQRQQIGAGVAVDVVGHSLATKKHKRR